MTTLLLVFGIALGIALAYRGWLNAGGFLAIASSIASPVLAVLGSDSKLGALRNALAFARELRPQILSLGWGFLGGLFGPLLLGAAIIFLMALIANRKKGNLDAWATAGRQANYLLVHGVRDYLGHFAPSTATVRDVWNRRRLDFQSVLLETLRRTLAAPMDEQRFKDAATSTGATFLRQLFESDQTIEDFRLAIYRFSDDKKQLLPLVTVNKGDWSSHSSEPLLVEKCFLAEAISEGKPLIYPRDKKRRKFQLKRRKPRFKSFLAVPLPCDSSASANWGALTIDYVGGDSAFTKERVDAAADFARAIDLLYSYRLKVCAGAKKEATA